MSSTSEDFSKIGGLEAFVLPALWIFLVPVIALVFFVHAQGKFDDDFRISVLQEIRADSTLTAEQRNEAIAFYTEFPFSQLILQKEWAESVNEETRFYYLTFRWAIRLSLWSVVAGIVIFVLAGICVVLSLRSQQALFLSLTISWHSLRIYSAAQVLIQSALLVALSFWITALWFNFYSVELVGITGLLAIVAVGAVIKAIFTFPNLDFFVEGNVIKSNVEMPIWDELRAICEKIGTKPPKQVVAGIDDNFFVTEQPVIVGDQGTYHGRTLFVSLSLLKQLDGAEAKAVLAHEMAHFSGQDTLYSRKISPLLNRYNNYLESLHAAVITIPIFHFVNCFRALFELSIGRHSRQREFRADRIAVETSSPRAFGSALLRIVAYSRYRSTVEQEVFSQDFVLESANVSEQIERGFHEYAQVVLSSPDLGEIETAHPFDSHPPLSQRLRAVGVSLATGESKPFLATAGNGEWFGHVRDAEQLERKQWNAFEERFRQFHEQTLPYRFLPQTNAEREVVVKAFPKIAFDSKVGSIEIDHETIRCATWRDSLHWSEIESCVLDEGVLEIRGERSESFIVGIKMKWFDTIKERQDVLNAIEAYYSRYVSAAHYQGQKEFDSQVEDGTGS